MSKSTTIRANQRRHLFALWLESSSWLDLTDTYRISSVRATSAEAVSVRLFCPASFPVSHHLNSKMSWVFQMGSIPFEQTTT